IIGVVAAMTIPTLISKYHEKQTYTRLKETYSIIAQALRSVEEEYGTPESWNISQQPYQEEDSLKIAKILLTSLKVAQDCGVELNSSCIYNGSYKYLNGSQAGKYGGNGTYKIVLLNGTSISFGHWNSSELIDFFIDINGTAPPNQIGRDLFTFGYFTNKGLYPLGAPGTTEYDCDKTKLGWGCTYYLLKNGNMDYLK
ncbi:MAG: hypothetical protein K2F57_03835, partial [Candidatus Gastranaerophilales bacterium]|nr:hypothetical protein [Candidatus Gastranaerophilales bacterium]